MFYSASRLPFIATILSIAYAIDHKYVGFLIGADSFSGIGTPLQSGTGRAGGFDVHESINYPDNPLRALELLNHVPKYALTKETMEFLQEAQNHDAMTKKGLKSTFGNDRVLFANTDLGIIQVHKKNGVFSAADQKLKNFFELQERKKRFNEISKNGPRTPLETLWDKLIKFKWKNLDEKKFKKFNEGKHELELYAGHFEGDGGHDATGNAKLTFAAHKLSEWQALRNRIYEQIIRNPKSLPKRLADINFPEKRVSRRSLKQRDHSKRGLLSSTVADFTSSSISTGPDTSTARDQFAQYLSAYTNLQSTATSLILPKLSAMLNATASANLTYTTELTYLAAHSIYIDLTGAFSSIPNSPFLIGYTSIPQTLDMQFNGTANTTYTALAAQPAASLDGRELAQLLYFAEMEKLVDTYTQTYQACADVLSKANVTQTMVALAVYMQTNDTDLFPKGFNDAVAGDGDKTNGFFTPPRRDGDGKDD